MRRGEPGKSTGLASDFRRPSAALASDPETGAFCHGDQPGLADICLARIVVVARIFKIAIPDVPTIDRIIARCEALPAFAKSEPSCQVGAPT